MVLTLLTASAGAFALALVSAVAGFGGGVLFLPVFTALFGLRVAIPVLTLAHAPLSPLKRLLGAFLIAVVIWRRRNPHPEPPSDAAFTAVGAASGLGSALLGSVAR